MQGDQANWEATMLAHGMTGYHFGFNAFTVALKTYAMTWKQFRGGNTLDQTNTVLIQSVLDRCPDISGITLRKV